MPERPQVFADRCPTCVFRPGDPMMLGTKRFRRLIRDNREAGVFLICHETIYDQTPELGEVMCRGFFDAYGETTRVGRVMEALFGPGWYDVVPAPQGVPDA